MTDPTDMVLTGSFAAAFTVFVVSAAVRSGFPGKPRPFPLDGPGSEIEPTPTDRSSPYEAPRRASTPPSIPVGRVPVWFYRPADLAGAALVFLLFGGLFLLAAGLPEDRVAKIDPGTLLVNIGFQFIIAGIVTIIALRRVSLAEWLGLRWPSWQWIILIAPGAVAFMWAVFFGLQVLGYVKWMESLGVETVQETVKLLQESKDPAVLGLMAFAAAIAAPLCEEVVFRGFFYAVLKKFSGAWPAAFCSALVFAAAHGNLAALLPLFIFGALLVFIYEKTGSIWAPIAVHFCFNSATLIVQMAARFYDLPIQPAP